MKITREKAIEIAKIKRKQLHKWMDIDVSFIDSLSNRELEFYINDGSFDNYEIVSLQLNQ